MQAQAQAIYPQRSAVLLLELIAEGQTPGWILDYLDIELIKMAAGEA